MPVWKRGPGGGFALASLGAFVVIEARAHAAARGAKCLARLSAVMSDRTSRRPGDVQAMLMRMWDALGDKTAGTGVGVISGATGAEPATSEERAFFARHGDIAVRATGSYVGHGIEPQFVLNIALAAVALGHATLYPPGDDSGVERPMQGPLTRAIVTGIGQWRGEGLALVEAP
jgi:3-oxoacyl-[acyl-carrier-protein] synthase II